MKNSARERVSELDGGRETHNGPAARFDTEHPGVEIEGSRREIVARCSLSREREAMREKRRTSRGDDVDSGSAERDKETRKRRNEKRHTLLITV
jgi:hypothetical protein